MNETLFQDACLLLERCIKNFDTEEEQAKKDLRILCSDLLDEYKK